MKRFAHNPTPSALDGGLPLLILFTLLLLPSLLFADIRLKDLEAMPKSYAKDFYIWRFFDQNITPDEADQAFYQIKSVNWKLIRRYAKKTKMPGFAMAAKCYRLKPSALPAKDPACSAIAITPYKFTKLSPTQRIALIKQLKDYPDLFHWMEVMSANHPFQRLIQSDNATFFTIFNRCGRTWRVQYLNHPIPTTRLKELSRDKAFAQSVKLIVTDPKLTHLQTSLLGIESKNLNHQATFFLAMNALKHNRPVLAQRYLHEAYKKAWLRFDKDKVLFWLAMIDPKGNHLTELSKSFDLNIYTLYAHEKLKTPWPRIATPKFQKTQSDYNISDPFAWLKTLNEIHKKKNLALLEYSKRFAYKRTEGHYGVVMARASFYKTHYFPIPYEEAYEGLSIDDKALMLALARQESLFIPASISPSYALGMMQIMPFLVKALAKERHEPFDLDAMFIPEKNIAYARTHLKYLKRFLWHPLFIAYAYNGGIGFTKRLLTKWGSFQRGAYEPWLSMELVHYDESRRYGKKVLANYIVYKKILGEPIDVASVVETLTEPRHTDRFRSRLLNASKTAEEK